MTLALQELQWGPWSAGLACFPRCEHRIWGLLIGAQQPCILTHGTLSHALAGDSREGQRGFVCGFAYWNWEVGKRKIWFWYHKPNLLHL